MKINLLYIILFVLFLSGCSFYDIDYECNCSEKINIYLVKDQQVVYGNTNVDLSELELEKTPWLKHEDINFYDWSAHIIYLKREIRKQPYSGRYFVLKVDREPLFLGYFFPPYQSSIPQVPAIIAADDFFLPSDVVGLDGFGFYSSVKPLSENEALSETLINSGLYRGGINVELLEVKKKNSSTVIYKYKIENRDKTKIYVLDPDKMNGSRFHYYTNGVSFRKGSTYFFSENKSVTSSENIHDSWYYGIRSGSSITRTVELEGFNSLPDGEFSCSFSFPGAALKKDEWKKNDGRIWLGSFRVEKEMSFR